MSHVTELGRMTIREFLGFYESRPDEEHWELVDGVPYMMTPPKIIHQVIADNLLVAINERLDSTDRSLIAVRQIGIELAEVDHDRPEPEISVIDTSFTADQRHGPRFELVVEVLSPSDRKTLAKKLGYYRAHGDCHTILVVHAHRVRIHGHRRTAGGWSETILTDPGAPIESAWGPLCTVGRAYSRTPLGR